MDCTNGQVRMQTKRLPARVVTARCCVSLRFLAETAIEFKPCPAPWRGTGSAGWGAGGEDGEPAGIVDHDGDQEAGQCGLLGMWASCQYRPHSSQAGDVCVGLAYSVFALACEPWHRSASGVGGKALLVRLMGQNAHYNARATLLARASASLRYPEIARVRVAVG